MSQTKSFFFLSGWMPLLLTCDCDEDALHPELAHLDRVLPVVPPRREAVPLLLLFILSPFNGPIAAAIVPEARVGDFGALVVDFVVLQKNRIFEQHPTAASLHPYSQSRI